MTSRRCVAVLAAMAGLASMSVAMVPPARGAASEDGAAAAAESELTRGLDEVHGLMAALRWREARARLLGLVRAHGDRDYVRHRRSVIRDDLQRCAVRLAVARPKIEDLVQGELAYDRSTAELRLRLTAETLGDWERHGDVSIHPIAFTGPYRIAVRGTRYGSRSLDAGIDALRDGDPLDVPSILVGIREDRGHQILFGFHAKRRGAFEISRPTEIHRLGRSGHRPLAQDGQPPLRLGERYILEVRVEERSIVAIANGRRLVAPRRADDPWGRIGFTHLATSGLDEILIEGRAGTDWFEGLLDTAMRAAEERFLATYDPDRDLPAWLAADGADDGTSGDGDLTRTVTLPWHFPSAQLPLVRRLDQLVLRGRYEEILSVCTVLGPDGDALHPELAAFYTTLALLGLQHFDDAIRHGAGLVERNPDFLEGRRLHASLLLAAGRLDEALTAYRRAFERDPAHAETATALIELLMLTFDLEGARDVVLEARRAGAGDPELTRLEAVLTKALRGPNWTRTHRHRSRHYEVRTDLPPPVGEEAAAELERTHERCAKELGPLPPAVADRPAVVYLFSGKAGFLAYTDDLFERPAHSVAGLYSLGLKQLLIWNQPDRGRVMETVRHEAVHQYMDRLGAHPPVWVCEGLATILAAGGDDVTLRPIEVRLLQSRLEMLPKLSELVRMSDASFTAGGSLHYRQAAAFLLFLRRGDAAATALHARLMRAARQRLSVARFADEVFDDLDLEQLDTRFREFVRRLPSGD